MKKYRFLAFAAVLFVLFALSSCRARLLKNDFYPARVFSADFKLTKNDFECGGDLVCSSYNNIRISFTYPEGLSFFNVSVDENDMSSEIGDRSDSVLLNELPEDSAIKLFVNALRAFIFTNVDFRRDEDGNYNADIEIAGLDLVGSFLPDGRISGIECVQNGLKIEIICNENDL